MSAVKPLQQLLPEIGQDVADGLCRNPKSLPPRLFYDAAGSQCFEEITALPEYYLTRVERAILEANARQMVERAGESLAIVELGAGTAAKTGILLRAALRRQLRVAYYPIDVSESALKVADARLKAELPQVKVIPVVADYTSGLGLLEKVKGRKLVLYLGSSIGNFELETATDLLRTARSHLSSGDCLLLGTDMVKSAALLVPAYNDTKRVTERFNKNVLVRINRELGGHFDLHTFRHVACWNPQRSRMEMHLESTRTQVIQIDALNLEISFAAGERIHTENSYKYTPAMISGMLQTSGFELEQTWTDRQRWFAVHLARVSG